MINYQQTTIYCCKLTLYQYTRVLELTFLQNQFKVINTRLNIKMSYLAIPYENNLKAIN